MMRSEIEIRLWVLALASKCKLHTSSPVNNNNNYYYMIIIMISSLFWLVIKWWGGAKSSSSRIGGPRGLPLIGSMELMTGLAHRKIAAAAECWGAKRLMAFSVGETPVIVTCSPDVAKEILSSAAFADRPVKESAYSLMFNRAIGFAPYGVYWRTLRKIAATHLFCPKQIKASEEQRMVISNQMVEMFRRRESRPVCVRDVLKRASLSSMMWSVFGRRYGVESESAEAAEVRMLVEEGYGILGVLNWRDHLPWLSDFDPQGIRYRCAELVPKVNRFVNAIIQQHRAQPTPQLDPDFTHVLLSLQPSTHLLSDSDLVAVLWEMIFRGTDTVAVLMEWILARLVLHPDVQSRAHEELDRVVGRSRAVTESDVTKLVYLECVVKEVLRLHPPGPLLSWARLATVDTVVDGREVAAGTTAMVNMWAISRDPEIWREPTEFRPERFAGEQVSVMGSDLRLAPFGSGRRACPGKALGWSTVTFWVASLLHNFDFQESEDKHVDLSEVLKLSCEMANPLILHLRPRPPLLF